ncbi:hypothetical protein STAS_18236 [Striga asiatica]|uniref:Uncharacterized protein n=1 Tax=Striga asiatica TaxID=4170 RepID=A0A5A7Q8E6_STRAF|nr:hypothetical protein STAS_18236 [Striga asiatica]
MPKNSRHKSHKQSKHSSKGYSDSEEDVVKMKEKSSKDESSTRGHRESASGEKRKISSQLREVKGDRDLNGHGNGDVVEEYVSSKRRKEKTDTVIGGDRWKEGGEEKGDNSERIVEKEIHKGESLKLEKEIHKSKENSTKGESMRSESKSKSKRRESGSAGERKEDILVSVVVEKEESKSKGESKRKSERDSSSRKDGKESKDKDRRSEKEKNGGHESKSGDADMKLVDFDVGKQQGTQLVDLVGERLSKRSRENNERTSLDDLRTLDLDKDIEKKPHKKIGNSSEREKYYEEPKESEVRRSSSKIERSKDLKYKDDKHKDGIHSDKYQEDGYRDDRRRDEKYREEADKDNKYHDERYREDGERDSRRRDDRHREDADQDSRRKDEKHRDNGERNSRRMEEKYHEGAERESRKDNKYREDRVHEDGDKYGRHADERYYEDEDRDDRRRDSRFRDESDRDYRHKEEKCREDTERDVRYKDSKQGDGYDREKRPRDSNLRDEHTSRDRSGDKSDPKRYRDDGYAADHHVRKSSAYDESPTRDDRAGRYRDDQGRRRTNEKEDYGDVKSRSSKDQRYDSEKKSASSGRMDPGSDRVRSSRNVDVELTSGHNRRRASPTPGSHAQRAGKQDESKYRDYSYEERCRHSMNSSRDHAGLEKTPSRSFDKLGQKDDGAHFGTSPSERRLKPDIRSSPLPLVDKSPSSSVDRRPFNVRRNIDVDESTQRSGGIRDWKEKDYPAREGRTIHEFGTNVQHPSEDLIQQADADTLSVSSPFARNTHYSSSSKLMPPPPPSLLGPSEDDSHRKPNMRHRRMGEPNIGRMQGNNNAWRGVQTWPPPVPNGFLPFPHAPPPVGFHSVMQPFHAPPMFGVRPSLELSHHHPSPYHVPDADRFVGPGRPLGWRSQLDDTCPPPLHGWDTSSTLFGDEPHIFVGRPEWDLARNISGGRGWETSGDLWKGANRTPSVDLPSYEKESNSIRSGDEAMGSESVQPLPNEKSQAVAVDGADDFMRSAKTVEKNDEVGAAVISSGDSGGGVGKMSGKDDVPLCSVYLSKLDLSADLAEPELFDKCTGLIDDKITFSAMDDSKILYMEDAEAKMGSSGLLSVTLFASSDDSVFKKSMSLYKRQKENVRAEYGEKPKLSDVFISNSNKEDKVVKADETEKLYPTDGMQGVEDKTGAMKHDIDQPAGNVVTENLKEAAADMDLEKHEKDDEPMPEERVEGSDTPFEHVKDVPLKPGIKNEELELVDVKYDPLLNSDVLSEASEAMVPELVNLSRIHHSPESTH